MMGAAMRASSGCSQRLIEGVPRAGTAIASPARTTTISATTAQRRLFDFGFTTEGGEAGEGAATSSVGVAAVSALLDDVGSVVTAGGVVPRLEAMAWRSSSRLSGLVSTWAKPRANSG